MQTSTHSYSKQVQSFPPFELKRLLETIFAPKAGEKLCILIDLDNPLEIKDFAFLHNTQLPVQRKAYDVFYQGLTQGIMQELKLAACDIYAYKKTGGSNLELPEIAYAPDGSKHPMESDIYSKYDIILCIGTYSATAPMTASSKRFGFRGGTMHGLNDIILKSGLAVDYNEVSRKTEVMRKGMTQADSVDIHFEVDNKPYHLKIDLGKQEAQKSHGLCRKGPDIANLPAGEVYFVPVNAKGDFPVKFEEDNSLGVMHVEQGKVTNVSLLKGNVNTINKYNAKFKVDPPAGILGELGFGTQLLPFSGADIQDEKIFGTFHLATGRNDHLNGNVTKDRFHDLRNASHDDILFSSTKTPEIHIKSVRMQRQGESLLLIENDEPSEYLQGLLK